MKRPQFSIRLLLLVVALAAVLIAWRQAVWKSERADRDSKIRNLETQIAVQQRYQERYTQWNLPNPAEPDVIPVSPAIERQISELQKQLQAMKP